MEVTPQNEADETKRRQTIKRSRQDKHTTLHRKKLNAKTEEVANTTTLNTHNSTQHHSSRTNPHPHQPQHHTTIP